MSHPSKPFAQLVDRNDEHLRLLGLYHGLITAGFLLLVLLMYALPLLIGPRYYQVVVLFKPLTPQLLLAGLLLSLIQVTVMGLNAWCLFRRKNRLSCMVLSCAECLCLPPLGFILGLSAVLVLRREAVAVLFQKQSP